MKKNFAFQLFVFVATISIAYGYPFSRKLQLTISQTEQACKKDLEECTAGDLCCGFTHRCDFLYPTDKITRCIAPQTCVVENGICGSGDYCCKGLECREPQEDQVKCKNKGFFCYKPEVRKKCPLTCSLSGKANYRCQRSLNQTSVQQQQTGAIMA
ncbi:uncharacterized protein LOC124434485 [Xenia sp. Carnegie-2017]|uniref:uncharacterized protein LOC124434485 n=1 Tax=Xenia sp. Carnegie-2017 TaxID=2897299 RepID=UPI001F041B1A|nr:uncharacterized protein LOC124434485 [Xenia sp. Carnegie-2017]